MKCFYHGDADGRCAGYWVSKGYGIKDCIGATYSPSTYELETTITIPQFIEINYGKPFPLDTILKDETVYIVDYSIEPEEMEQLLEITPNVIWIDHHKTAIEKYADFLYPIAGLRKDGIAGCMLTYCYLNIMCENGKLVRPFGMWMTDSAPTFTKLIADWDVWKFEFGDDTKNFITAFNAYDFAPKSDNWETFADGDAFTFDLIHQGKTIRRYRDHWAAEYCRTHGFEVTVDGHKVYALNLGLCNSEYFLSIRDGYNIFMPFSFDGEKWIFSLYSSCVDVSAIAKKYGGGGHRGASGFQCKELPTFVIGVK